MTAPTPGTVLVLRALHLGDLLVAVPALRALRRAFPAHRVVLATSPALAPLVHLTGCVDELLPADGLAPLAWGGPPPDVAVNLHGTGPQSHRLLDALAPRRRIGLRNAEAGWDGPDWGVLADRHPHERERWCALLTAHGIPADPADLRLPAPRPGSDGPVLVHPGARFGSKRWPAERFAAVAAALERDGHRVVLTGSADERPLAADVATAAGLPAERVLAGRTDLADLCALVASARLVVCGDTGIAHIASAFTTPSVVLFGPVGPEQWGPPADGPHEVLADPRHRRGDPFADDPDSSLLAIGVADVLAAAGRVLAQPRGAGIGSGGPTGLEAGR